jgi:tetratricopeptide (TPR) repeat protein
MALTLASVGFASMTLMGPAVHSAQVSAVPPEQLRPVDETLTLRQRILTLEQELISDPDSYELRWRLAEAYATLAAFEADVDTQKELGYQARAYARSAKEISIDEVEGRYWLAAAAGLLASIESGRTIIGLADEAWVESGWVIEADSLHAGAHYIRGRLHAAIRRQSAFRRFVARTVLGGEAVGQASWTLAEHHLRRAAELDSSLPMHHFELAAALRDMGQRYRAVAELQKAVDATGSSLLDERYRERAAALIDTVVGGR